MAKRITDEMRQTIRHRSAAGLTSRQIADELGISKTSAAEVLQAAKAGRLPPVVWTPPEPSAETVATATPSAPVTEPDLPTAQALMAMAWKTAKRLDEWSDQAQGEQDRGSFKALARDLLLAVKELTRLLPPAPPDHESSPDMLEASKVAREAMLALIDRELDRAG